MGHLLLQMNISKALTRKMIWFTTFDEGMYHSVSVVHVDHYTDHTRQDKNLFSNIPDII